MRKLTWYFIDVYIIIIPSFHVLSCYFYVSLILVAVLKKFRDTASLTSGGFRVGPRAPLLFLDQTEDQRAEKCFLETGTPPYLMIWMTGPLLSEGLDPPLWTVDEIALNKMKTEHPRHLTLVEYNSNCSYVSFNRSANQLKMRISTTNHRGSQQMMGTWHSLPTSGTPRKFVVVKERSVRSRSTINDQ